MNSHNLAFDCLINLYQKKSMKSHLRVFSWNGLPQTTACCMDFMQEFNLKFLFNVKINSMAPVKHISEVQSATHR